MTLKQLIDKYSYADIAPYIVREVEADGDDLRPMAERLLEMELGFAQLKTLKPTFGHIDTHIEVKRLGRRWQVTNLHIGASSDLLSHRLVVAPDVEASEPEILAQCVYQLVAHQAATTKYRDDDDFDDLDNPIMSRGMR